MPLSFKAVAPICMNIHCTQSLEVNESERAGVVISWQSDRLSVFFGCGLGGFMTSLRLSY